MHGIEKAKKLRESQSKRMKINNPSKRPEVIRKRKQNYFNKYGVNSPMKNPEVVKKMMKTQKEVGLYEANRKRAIENPIINRPGARKNQKKTFLEKYGNENIFKVPSVIKKISNSKTDWDFYNQHGCKKSEYPYNSFFNEVTKENIRNQWNNRCVVTGITNEEHKQLYCCNLHIHHWNYDKNTKDSYWLVPVCQPINTMAEFDKEGWMSIFSGIVEEEKPWYEIAGEL
jgi:hypothetical protein